MHAYPRKLYNLHCFIQREAVQMNSLERITWYGVLMPLASVLADSIKKIKVLTSMVCLQSGSQQRIECRECGL